MKVAQRLQNDYEGHIISTRPPANQEMDKEKLANMTQVSDAAADTDNDPSAVDGVSVTNTPAETVSINQTAGKVYVERSSIAPVDDKPAEKKQVGDANSGPEKKPQQQTKGVIDNDGQKKKKGKGKNRKGKGK